MCHLWEEFKDDGNRTFSVKQILATRMLGAFNGLPWVAKAPGNWYANFTKAIMVCAVEFQSMIYMALSPWSNCWQSDMKIYSVLNLNFTHWILQKCVLIMCELTSLLLDALNLVRELGYCIASRQIGSGTNACKNTQTSLCSVVEVSLVILLCPWNWVATLCIPAKESASLHWTLRAPVLLDEHVRVTCTTPVRLLNLPGIMSQTRDIWKHTQCPLQEYISLEERRSDNLIKKANSLNRIFFFFLKEGSL